MLVEFSKRLQLALKQSEFYNIEQGVLSMQLGVSRQALRKWLEGKALPSQTRLPLIAEVLKVSHVWLATGQGSIRSINAQVLSGTNSQQLKFSLNVEEVKLLKSYRMLTSKTQKIFSNLLGNLTPPSASSIKNSTTKN